MCLSKRLSVASILFHLLLLLPITCVSAFLQATNYQPFASSLCFSETVSCPSYQPGVPTMLTPTPIESTVGQGAEGNGEVFEDAQVQGGGGVGGSVSPLPWKERVAPGTPLPQDTSQERVNTPPRKGRRNSSSSKASSKRNASCIKIQDNDEEDDESEELAEDLPDLTSDEELDFEALARARQTKYLKAKGKGKTVTTEATTDAAAGTGGEWLTTHLEAQTQSIASMFQVRFNRLNKSNKALAKDVKETKRKVGAIEASVASVQEAISKHDQEIADLKRLYLEAEERAEKMRREIVELRSARVIPDAEGSCRRFLAGSAPSEASTGYLAERGVDRANNIYGTWSWAPTRAIEKQLRDLFDNIMPNHPLEPLKVKIVALDVMQPRANYAFIKFEADSESGKSSQQVAYVVKSWLIRHPQKTVGSEKTIWTQPCRPEHERQARGILNSGRAFLHTIREELKMEKIYEYLGEAVPVISGSYKAGKESITWKSDLIATIVEPSGIKQIEWHTANVVKNFQGCFAHFNIEFFNKKWGDWKQRKLDEKA
eukprot:TRINITY_DN89998_c0_g1_i1.p1 TRINITY_DN89998_c0_g1~~TRINITY_DN89998_c0_g1_i1.p1  ORF type:complete len:543 (-),score=93.12 TRINITY_DN89998_c0_g1_i1:139-1767(-)